MTKILTFPSQALSKRIPDSVMVQLDLGQWSAAMLSEGRVTKRHFCCDRSEAAVMARELAQKYGLRLLVDNCHE